MWAAKLARAAYAEEFRQLFGAHIFDDPARAYAQALLALERFQLEDPSFHPYSSKFDDYLDGKAQLSEQEQRGMALFDDPKRGNCATCHLDRKGVDGSHPLFTDYQFEALGVPRNPEILANSAHDYYDMGIVRTAAAQTNRTRVSSAGCSKRRRCANAATRAVFFHNGRFHTLKEALRFYVRRDTDPRLWYPVSAAGAVVKFDDLPSAARANIDVLDEPLTRKEGGRHRPGRTQRSTMSSPFLETLSDRDVVPVVSLAAVECA